MSKPKVPDRQEADRPADRGPRQRPEGAVVVMVMRRVRRKADGWSYCPKCGAVRFGIHGIHH